MFRSERITVLSLAELYYITNIGYKYVIRVIDITISGRYIKTRLSLCHKPSLLMKESLNSGLSDITNRAKKTNEITKQTMQKIPFPLSAFLNERIPTRSGTNRKSINPITEPAPWIFEATVTCSLDSFTLKKHVKMQAPTAKTAIKTEAVTASAADTML